MPSDIKEDGDTELPSTSSSEKSSSNLEEKTPGKDKTDFVTGVGVILFIILFLGGGILKGIWSDPDGKAFLTRWWAVIGAVIGLVVAVILLIAIRTWFKHTTAERRTGFVVFAFLPVLLIGMAAITRLPATYQIIALRSVFLVVVCLLPALIYYLFIATRKISLLNDYFINLGRLGLLEPRCTSKPSVGAPGDEAKTECRVRLLNYLQKFEALYGPVPRQMQDKIMEAKNPLSVLAEPGWRTSGSSGIVQIFTAETAIPVILASVLVALGWFLALPPIGPGAVSEVIQRRGFWSTVFDINEEPITYAFLGAYFFSLQMLFRRYVREDLRKTAYVAVSLRIILALIGTWAVVTAIKATGQARNSWSLAVIGFVIGVFPRVAWQFIQGFTKTIITKFKFGTAVLPSLESRLPVSDLDGLTVWHESRLEEQDIENIPNMASAEIVDLMIATRFPPDRIIDWVDQAILYTHLGPPQSESEKKGDGSSRREKLRLNGIRTATSLIEAFAKAQKRPDRKQVTKLLSDASSSHIQSLIDAIQTEPNLELICNWRRMH
jgi:hypothetical protein